MPARSGLRVALPRFMFAALFCLAFTATGRAQSGSAPIEISVDATHAAQKILHAELKIPATPGPLTLYYPKWMPADHSPDGPIPNLAGLKFTAAGKEIPWEQDLVDMYTFHVDVPSGANAVDVHLDFLMSAPGPTIDFAASGSSKLFILMWNQVVLYPAGRPAHEIIFEPKLRVPENWKFNTALPVSATSGNEITFAPVPLDLLVDSPVQAGQYVKVIQLSPGQNPPHELDVAADDAWALDIPAELIDKYKRLVAEASALYQSHHYRDYHFLFTLSDNVLPLGQEHHESSDDRVAERTIIDPNLRLLEATLFPHEFTHSWNGQFRRPVGLATPDFQQPMKGELLWVYEGLTDYLGTVLAARSGLWTPVQAREQLASLASTLQYRAGRTWRSLQNTANAAQILYFAPAEWRSERRSTDFYIESILIWLDVDVTMRRLTNGRRSMNDFCRSFLGPPDGEPVIKTYTFDELVSALNDVAPYDWRSFLRQRLDSTAPEAPLGGISGGGWRLVYSDQPNEMRQAELVSSGTGDFTESIGLVVKKDGTIVDANPKMIGFQSGLSPYMQIVAVAGREFSVDELARAVRESRLNPEPITLLVSNTGSFERREIRYRDGIRQPHLERVEGAPDYLDDILKPLAGR
jgi:predicted metalloprotease with PDZ domain